MKTNIHKLQFLNLGNIGRTNLFLILMLFTAYVSGQAISAYPMPTGYTDAQVRVKNCITLDNFGNKWLGFKLIGLGKFDGFNWTIFSTSNSGLPSNAVNAIAKAAGNSIWVGTNAGLAEFNGLATWSINTAASGAIPSDTVYTIAVMSRPVGWHTSWGCKI